MAQDIPIETIKVFARTICEEARKYGFRQIDFVRLINELLDTTAGEEFVAAEIRSSSGPSLSPMQIDEFPLRSDRLRIRQADPERDTALLKSWMADRYGQHFLLSCATAQSLDLESLMTRPSNRLGIVLSESDEPVGAVAFLDIDRVQKRAELRKLIGVASARGKGYAEEATRLWIQYGGVKLGLQKIYVSTLQTHLRNIQLNESIGFRVEGVLHREILIGSQRHDVLRMGLCFDELA